MILDNNILEKNYFFIMGYDVYYSIFANCTLEDLEEYLKEKWKYSSNRSDRLLYRQIMLTPINLQLLKEKTIDCNNVSYGIHNGEFYISCADLYTIDMLVNLDTSPNKIIDQPNDCQSDNECDCRHNDQLEGQPDDQSDDDWRHNDQPEEQPDDQREGQSDDTNVLQYPYYRDGELYFLRLLMHNLKLKKPNRWTLHVDGLKLSKKSVKIYLFSSSSYKCRKQEFDRDFFDVSEYTKLESSPFTIMEHGYIS